MQLVCVCVAGKQVGFQEVPVCFSAGLPQTQRPPECVGYTRELSLFGCSSDGFRNWMNLQCPVVGQCGVELLQRQVVKCDVRSEFPAPPGNGEVAPELTATLKEDMGRRLDALKPSHGCSSGLAGVWL